MAKQWWAYTPEQIAQVCHEANRGLQAVNADPNVPVAPPWDELDQDMKDSILVGVKGVQAGNTAEQSHEQWLITKESQGWAYGPKKDAEKKTHPCMVPYDQLPVQDKVKDTLFAGIVKMLDG